MWTVVRFAPCPDTRMNAGFDRDGASTHPNPNAAVYLSLRGVGWQHSRRMRMVCAAGPFWYRTHPRRLPNAQQRNHCGSAPVHGPDDGWYGFRRNFSGLRDAVCSTCLCFDRMVSCCVVLLVVCFAIEIDAGRNMRNGKPVCRGLPPQSQSPRHPMDLLLQHRRRVLS